MNAIDFEYDGLTLSGFGYMICDFDNGGSKTVSNGSQITLNTVKALSGHHFDFTNSTYDDCIETTFQICKDVCSGELAPITVKEIRTLSSWLNRKGFHKFKLLNEEFFNLYMEASFNINLIEFDGLIYGLELNMITNKPFLLQEPYQIEINNIVENGKHSFLSESDDEGYIYPHTKITINTAGTLQITNSQENRITQIKNCVVGEIITMDYPIIQSSVSSHKIQNDFNWNFLRIANSYRNNINELTISLPCTIKMTYSPIAKVGI